MLGKGGMGEVYRARDLELDREVAVKLLPDGFADEPQRLLRLRREARTLASVQHPNVACLHSLEEHEQECFLVLEVVPGETLARRLERGSLSLAETLGTFRQIAAGLEAVHALGIAHRDLKPSNVQLLPDGTAKLLDFGLAKAVSTVAASDDLSDDPTRSESATVAGKLLGTARYMSPEQVRGMEATRQSDVWAFACCLYEALAGSRVFDGPTNSDVLADVLRREPDLNALPAHTPPQLQALLSRCLRKDLSERQRDIGDVALELKEVAQRNREEAPSHSDWAGATPASDTRAEPSSMTTVAVLLAVLALLALALWLSPESRERKTAPTPAVMPTDASRDGVITFEVDREQLLQLILESREPEVLEASPEAGGREP